MDIRKDEYIFLCILILALIVGLLILSAVYGCFPRHTHHRFSVDNWIYCGGDSYADSANRNRHTWIITLERDQYYEELPEP